MASEADPAPPFFRRVDSLVEPTQAQIRTMLQLQLSDDDNDINHPAQPRSAHNGLICLSESSSSSAGHAAGSSIDVIAVHGLGGDARATWRHDDNGFNWLEHLHEELPGVRVFTFGYDSGVAFSGGSRGLTDHARYLLQLIKSERARSGIEHTRKIAFVCHGMGGLLVQQASISLDALLVASNERGIFASVRESFSAVVYLGTPHGGSRDSDSATVLCRMAEALVFTSRASRLLESFETSLLGSLREIAAVQAELEEELFQLLPDVHLSVFLERSPLPNRQDLLVDEDSCAPSSRQIPLLDHDHNQLCKHPSFTSRGMRSILSELRDVIKRNSAAYSSSLAEEKVAELPSEADFRDTVAALRNEALLMAAATDNLSAIERLVMQGANCDTQNSQGETPLLLACQNNHRTVAVQLLEEGANVQGCDASGISPLHAASKNGNKKLVLAILEKGADPNPRDKDNSTPLHRAAESGSRTTVRCLLEHGADWTLRNAFEELPARTARKRNKLGAMKALQAHARELQLTDARAQSSEAASKTRKRLEAAAKSGNIRAVEDLVDLGAEPTAAALYAAADGGHSDVVQVLADAAHDIDADAGFAGNALGAAAVRSGGHDTLRVLLDRGADVNWRGGHYGSALQGATANFRLDNVLLLLQRGADANAQCGHYGNALAAAARRSAQRESRGLVRLLLQHGADVDAEGPGVYGNALQTAVWMGRADMVEFLVQSGASATAAGQFGSALDIARRGAFRHNADETTAKRILSLLDEKDPDDLAALLGDE